jgi:hypothetical protein
VPSSSASHYDFYPKADKLLIRNENKWITNGAQWLLSHFFRKPTYKEEAVKWEDEIASTKEQM